MIILKYPVSVQFIFRICLNQDSDTVHTLQLTHLSPKVSESAVFLLFFPLKFTWSFILQFAQ